MATISENLQILKDSTDAIKQAIIDKGGIIEGDITTWADAISVIEIGGGSTEPEYIFTGTISWGDESCTIEGYLNKIPSGNDMWFLVALGINEDGITMANRRSPIAAYGTGPHSLNLYYDHLVSGYIYDMPSLCLFNLDADITSTNKIIPVKFQEEISTNPA